MFRTKARPTRWRPATARRFTVTIRPTRSAAVARDAGVDGSARQSRRRHQAGQQPGPGRHQSQQPTNPVVYYGNDIPAGSTFNAARNTNTPPNLDSINNVQNVYLPPGAGTNFSVTVIGTA